MPSSSELLATSRVEKGFVKFRAHHLRNMSALFFRILIGFVLYSIAEFFTHNHHQNSGTATFDEKWRYVPALLATSRVEKGTVKFGAKDSKNMAALFFRTPVEFVFHILAKFFTHHHHQNTETTTFYKKRYVTTLLAKRQAERITLIH